MAAKRLSGGLEVMTEMLAYLLVGDTCERINVDRSSHFLESLVRQEDDELPFVVNPGFVLDDGYTRLTLEKEGLYRFCSLEPGGGARQFLVSDGDALKFGESLSWCFHHSRNDIVVRSQYRREDFEASIKLLKRRALRMTCGSAARLATFLAIMNGLPASVISFRNPKATVGYAHKMLELKCKVRNKLILIDLDLRCYFQVDEQLADAQQILASVRNGRKEIRIRLFPNQNMTEASDYTAEISQGRMDFIGDYTFRTWAGRTQFLNEIFKGVVTRETPDLAS
jgi:hypothetical protein